MLLKYLIYSQISGFILSSSKRNSEFDVPARTVPDRNRDRAIPRAVVAAFAPIASYACNSGFAVSPKIPASVTQREYLQDIVDSMDTLAEIRVALDAASQRIDSGQARPDTRRFLDDLWAHVYDTAPVDLQPYVWSRLADLGDLLGVPQAQYAMQRQPPSSHYRL